MSWNGGFNYFQPSNEQQGRSQPSFPDSSSGNGASYHRLPTPQYPSTQTVPDPLSDVYHGSEHQNFRPSGSGEYSLAIAGPQSHGTSAAMNSYSTTVRSWGNLAYASSFGQLSRNHASPTQEGSSLQRIVDYNHLHPSGSYADSSAYGMTESTANHYADSQPDGVGGATTRDKGTSAEPSDSYVIPYTMYGLDGNRHSQPRTSSQGKRTTAQTTKGPNSSPRIADKVSTTSLSRATSNTVRGSELSKTPPQSQFASKPQSSREWSNADLNAPPGSISPTSGSVKKTSNLQPQKLPQANAISAARSSPNAQDQPSATQGQQHEQSRLESQLSNLEIKANGHNSEERTQAEYQYPTTVNPNEIFDNDRYQNSRAAAAAAAEAEAIAKAAANAAAKKAEAEASTLDTGGDSATKEQMEQMEIEMKKMIEKMRSFQSKDPTLFKQVLEKVRPSNRSSSAETTPKKESNRKSATVADDNDQSPSSNPTNNQLSLESALSAGHLQQDGPNPARHSAQRHKRKSASGAGKKSLHHVQTLDSGNVTPMSKFAVASTPTEVVNDAARNESPHPAVQGHSVPSATKSFNESRKPNPKTNRQSGPTPEVVYVKGAVPTDPQPADASPPSQKTPGSTKWPEETKWRLARITVKMLTSSSMNDGKTITIAEILDILDQTPSFPGLCKALERRGFNIDRGQFARLLLEKFPNPEPNNSDEQSSAMNRTNSHGLPNSGTANGPAEGSINGAVSRLTNRSNKSVNGRVSGAAQITIGQREPGSQSHGKNRVVNGYDGISQSTPRESSKKRTKKSRDSTGIGAGSQSDELDRSDQVGAITGSADRSISSTVRQAAPVAVMTQSGSRRFPDRSRLNQPHDPAAIPSLSKKEMARKRSFGELVDLTQDLSDEDHYSPVPRALLDTGRKVNDQAAKSSVVSAPSAIWDKARPTSVHLIPHKEKIKRRKLLGSADQSGLSSSVATEDESSDLSRFKYADSRRDLLQSAIIIRPINKKTDALRRFKYNPRTIARDILISAGKHPTQLRLNHHLDILRKEFAHVDQHSDLGTFRWDLVDPGGPEKTSTERQDVVMAYADDGDTGMENSAAEGRKKMKVSKANGEERVAAAGSVNTQPIKEKTHRRKSTLIDGETSVVEGSNGISPVDSHRRIIMLDNETPSAGELAEAIHSSSRPQHASPGEPQPRRNERPKDNAQPESAGSSPAKTSSRSRPSDAVPLRPSGLRNMMPSDGVAVVIETRPAGIGNEKKGSSATREPWRRKQEKPSINPSTPSYKVYKCLWKKCPYQLHNLENLRKHVRKHRQEFDDGPFPCLWANCGRSTSLIGESAVEHEEVKPLEFGSDTAWERHVNKKHVDRYAWEFGDGPSGHPSDAEASDFLSDSQGRRVTPRISANSSAPPDPLPLSSSKITARIYHKAHGNRTGAHQANAVFNSLVTKKRATGLGITKGGSPFLAEKMRASMEDEG